MTDRETQGDTVDSTDDSRSVGPEQAAGESDRIACTAAYEQDGLVVFYDTENPLAWIEADSTVEVGRMA